MPSKMTESEAKLILESEYKFHGECSVFGEALKKAINALEKKEKIKEALEKWRTESGGYIYADDDATELICTLNQILRSDEE